jgi:hypothetical protein
MTKIGTEKDICRVSFFPEHGEGFVVCLSAQEMEKNKTVFTAN